MPAISVRAFIGMAPVLFAGSAVGLLAVDRTFGNLRQRLVRSHFFIERLLQQASGVGVAKMFGQCPGRAVSSHLVMLHALGRRNDRGILGAFVSVSAHHLAAFTEQSFNPLT